MGASAPWHLAVMDSQEEGSASSGAKREELWVATTRDTGGAVVGDDVEHWWRGGLRRHARHPDRGAQEHDEREGHGPGLCRRGFSAPQVLSPRHSPRGMISHQNHRPVSKTGLEVGQR